MKHIHSRQRLRRQVRQRQRFGLGLGQRAVRQGHHPHGRAGQPAQHLPQQHPGPAHLVRGTRQRKGLAGPARRHRHDGGDEPADLGAGRARARKRRLPVLRLDAAAAAQRLPRRRGHARHADHRDLQRHLRRPASAPAVQEHPLRRRVGATAGHRHRRHRGRCSASSSAARRGCWHRTCARCTWGATSPPSTCRTRRSGCASKGATWSASASSSTAIPPPRWAACTAVPRCAPGTRSRPRRRWPRPSRSTAPSCASTRSPANTATPSCRPRTRSPRSAWSLARAGTARVPSPPRRARACRLMTEFIGLAYFAEIPVTIINVQRGGPVHRHAHAHAAGRHHQLRLCLARRHQARAAVSAGPARMFRALGRRTGPGRPAADAGVRDDRPGHRHEPAAVRALRLGRRRALRPRQGDERRRAGSRPRLRPLQGRRRRRHPLAHAARHAPHQGQLLHARHHARRIRALLRDRSRLPAQRAAAERQVPHRGHAGAAAGAARRGKEDALRRHLLRLAPARRWTRRWTAWRECRHPPRRAAAARLSRSRPACWSSSRRTTRSSWSSRTATRRCAAC